MDEHEHQRGEMRVINPDLGLHRLKRDFFQKRHLAAQCDALREGIDRALDATLAAAPVRRKAYALRRDPGRLPAHPEARWEQGCWEQWSRPTSDPAPDAWHRLIGYQVMLRNDNDNEEWGEIDLLGASALGHPLVIELKAPNSTDTPAEMMVEAASYALAIRNAWAVLSPQWQSEIERCGISSTVALPSTWPLLCVAPSGYWDTWIGTSPRARRVSPEARAALGRLRDAFGTRGYPVTFVSLENAETDASGIPRSIATSIVDPT